MNKQQRMTIFITKVRDYLYDKVENREIDVTNNQVTHLKSIFEDNNDGVLRYYLDEHIVDALPHPVIDAIEKIWTDCNLID